MIDDKTLKRAAGWIYQNRHTGYWTSPILVAVSHLDPRAGISHLSYAAAEAVFGALEEKGYLKKIDGDKTDVRGVLFQKYRIQIASLKDFRRFSEVPFYYFPPDSWIYYLEKYWAWFVVCITLVVTSFLNGFVGKLGERIGDKLTK